MTESTTAEPISIQITCNLPFALYYAGEFEARSRHGTVTVLLQRVRQERLDPRLGIEKGNFDVQGDRSGLVSYSNLTIRMDWPTFDSIAREVRGGTKAEVIQGVAGYVANRVIESYRVATRTPWVRTVAGKELFNLAAQIIRSDGVVEAIQIGFSGVGAITLPVTGLTDEAQQAFEHRLRSEDRPPIWDSLWLDSEDAVDRGDHRIGIILGHSALETLAHATVLAWLRDQNLDVAAVANKIGRIADERRRLQDNLSLEELAAFLNDTRKVEVALFNVVSVDPSWGYDRYAKFEELAAARNEVLHSGGAITLVEAQDHLQVIRAIMGERSRKDNLERIGRSKPRPASAVISELLCRPPHKKLAALLESHEGSGVEVTFWSRRRHPLPRQRHSSGVSIVRDGNCLRIFLPRRSELASADSEIELTRLLLKQVVIKEGWPFADVSERGPKGKLSLGPINWEGYAQIAADITDAALGWEIDRRLEEEGLNTKPRLERSADAITTHISDSVFTEPKWGEFDYFHLSIRILAIFMKSPDIANDLLALLRPKAPALADTVNDIVDSIKRSDWKSPHAAATAMLVLKSKLGILDTIGVREAPERRLRTRFNGHEIGLLGSTS